MTELERKLFAQNEQLKREFAELKNFSSAEIEILDETHVKFNGQIFAKTKKNISIAPFRCMRTFGNFTSATFPTATLFIIATATKPTTVSKIFNS